MLGATLGLDIVGAGVLVLASRNSSIPRNLQWSIAIVVGIAITSVALIATLVLTGTTYWLLLFWLMYLIPTALAFKDCRWQVPSEVTQEISTRYSAWLAGTAAIFALCAVAVASYNSPHGGWDAWGIWNLKARFLFFGIDDGTWIRLFTPEIVWSHPDYPLLLPTTIARYWLLLGKPSPWIPSIVSMLSLGLTLWLIHAAVKSSAGQLPANISIIVLLGATFFVQHAGSQFADNYLALFVVAAAIVLKQLLVSDYQSAKGWGMLYLLGILLGFAASTKNEGLLIAFVFLITYLAFVISRRDQGLPAISRSVIVLCAAWLLVFIPSFMMRYSNSVTNDVISAISLDLIKSSLSWERISSMFQLIGPLAMDFFLVPIIIATGVVIACCGRFRLSLAQNSVFLIAVPILILSGYVIVLWVTPHDLTWHVDTTFQRLLVHIWGALIFAFGSSISISAFSDQKR